MVPQGTWQKQMVHRPGRRKPDRLCGRVSGECARLDWLQHYGAWRRACPGYGGSVDLAVLMDADGNLRISGHPPQRDAGLSGLVGRLAKGIAWKEHYFMPDR
jgi:hypothetical protein